MKKSTFAWIGVISCLVLIVFFSFYIWLHLGFKGRSWTPLMPEPRATLFFEGKWGEGESEIGLHKATGKEGDYFTDGFTTFCVRENRVYIADTIKRRVSVYENGKFIHGYQYSSEILDDVGMVVNDMFVYLLDSRGYISKISLQSGEYLIKKKAIVENDTGLLTQNRYTIYLLNNLLVLNDNFYMNKCIATEDLSEIPCPFVSREDPSRVAKYIYLPQHYYAGIMAGADVWLYDSTGKKAGRVKGIDGGNLLYEVRRNYQIEPNGVYYVEHTKLGPEIYFKAWQH